MRKLLSIKKIEAFMKKKSFLFTALGALGIASAFCVQAAGIGGQVCQSEGKTIKSPDQLEFEKKSGTVICKDLENGVVRIERRYVKGRLTFSKENRANGSLEEEIEFYPNGERKYEKIGRSDGSYDWLTFNDKGSQEGVRRSFYPNNKLASEATYVDGESFGKSVDYYPSGKVKTLRFDERKGARVVEINYREDGQVSMLTCGPVSKIPEDIAPCGFGGVPGIVKTQVAGGGESTQTYVNGKKTSSNTVTNTLGGSSEASQNGISTKRDTFPSGRPEREIISDENKREVTEKRYAQSGQILLNRKTNFDGAVLEETQWFQNGSIKTKKVTTAELGTLVENFNDRGQLETTAAFKPGEKRASLQRSYHGNGKVAVELSRDSTGMSRRQEFDTSGQVRSDEDIFPDGSSKPRSK
jgi:antitoxin component YwqK of YwqJK toxin-antitoxin module